MSDYKIIFTGPVGAGKTTAITAISDTPPVSTDEAASDMTRSRKAGTTVAMDYGVLQLEGGERIHLYGTPGQERFDFMWEILTAGGLGLVLLIDNSRADPFRDLHFFLDAFRGFIAEQGVVIGITRTDLGGPGLDAYHHELAGRDLNPAVFEVDARERDDMRLLVKALLYSLDPGLGA